MSERPHATIGLEFMSVTITSALAVERKVAAVNKSNDEFVWTPGDERQPG